MDWGESMEHEESINVVRDKGGGLSLLKIRDITVVKLVFQKGGVYL